MGSLAVGYVIAWVTVVIYVSYLLRHNQLLARKVHDLEIAGKAHENDRPKSRAA